MRWTRRALWFVAALSLPVIALMAALPRSVSQSQLFNVSMGNNAYYPALITIHQGDLVRWANNDPVQIQHDVTTDTAWASGVMNPQNVYPNAYGLQFNTPGVFDYYCTFHRAEMTGRITVLPAPGTPSPLQVYFAPRVYSAGTPAPPPPPPIAAGASIHVIGAVYSAHLSATVTSSEWRYSLTDLNGAIYTSHGVFAILLMDIVNPYPGAEELSIYNSFKLQNPNNLAANYAVSIDTYLMSALKATYQRNTIYDPLTPSATQPMVFLFDVPSVNTPLQLVSLSPW